MFPRLQTKPDRQPTTRSTPVPSETLHLLSTVLQTAFRLHCTGDTVGGKGPWELVREVQQKLGELAQDQTAVSEERLARFIETTLAGSGLAPAGPVLKLVGTD